MLHKLMTMFVLGCFMLGVVQAVECTDKDDDGVALSSSREDGTFAVCVYKGGAGTCRFFSDGTFSSGSSSCPSGKAQTGGGGGDSSSSASEPAQETTTQAPESTTSTVIPESSTQAEETSSASSTAAPTETAAPVSTSAAPESTSSRFSTTRASASPTETSADGTTGSVNADGALAHGTNIALLALFGMASAVVLM